MRNLRILPAIVACTSWPLFTCTRNVASGSTSVTVPSSSIASSFAIILRRVFQRTNKKRGRPGLVQSGPAFLILRSASYDLSAELGDVLSRWAFLALHDVEFNALALGQRLEAVALNGGVVNEAILLSVIRGDKTKALGVVQPLYFAGGTHVRYILIQLCRSAVCAVPVRLLFVRGRNGRPSSLKTKKTWQFSRSPLSSLATSRKHCASGF